MRAEGCIVQGGQCGFRQGEAEVGLNRLMIHAVTVAPFRSISLIYQIHRAAILLIFSLHRRARRRRHRISTTTNEDRLISSNETPCRHRRAFAVTSVDGRDIVPPYRLLIDRSLRRGLLDSMNAADAYG